MSEQQTSNPLDSFVVTLEYTVAEINAILNLLSQLPFIQSVGPINSIHAQVGPQIEKAKAGLEAALATSKEETSEPKATT